MKLSHKSDWEIKAENLEKFLQKNLHNRIPKPNWISIASSSRRRVNFQIDHKNNLGFFAEKSHDLIEIEFYEDAVKEISNLINPLKKFLKSQEQNFFTQVALTLFDSGLDVVFLCKKEPNFLQTQNLITFAKTNEINLSYRIKNEITPLLLTRKNQIFCGDFKIDLESDVFLQATKSGLEAIIKIIRQEIAFLNNPSSNKKTLQIADIYCGFGAYSFAIYDLVKSIYAFEGNEKMVTLLNKNSATQKLAQSLKGEVRDLFSNPLKAKELNKFDFVIINPPRNGASPQSKEIAKSKLQNLVYVSCNPESFCRDAKILLESNFTISSLTTIDQFYSDKHLELVAIFKKSSSNS